MKRKYPWDRWLNRRRFHLVQGRDFQCRTYGMAQQVRNAATRLNLRVSIEIADDNNSLSVYVKG